MSIAGTKPVQKASLIGIVKSYVPYRDVATSQQTKSPRIIFEENSGLAAVAPVDHILKTIELAMKRTKNRVAQSRWKAKQQAASQPNPALNADESPVDGAPVN